MKLNFNEYKDKVRACWIGKNIGGTLGAPYEGLREKLNVTDFKTQRGEALPNDDLDLQLIWLHAMEMEGPKHLDAAVLADYWQSFMVAYFGEYAIAKRNMELGITPPLTGETENNSFLKHSNGAWIRTEIWACLFPCLPDLAVRYAIEDAKVDHGTGEGTFAAMFIAAIESAAFFVSDERKLIEIGLAKVPVNSRCARTIRLLLDCFDSSKSADEARDAILEENSDIGEGWFSAPSNIGFALLGLLYGGGDFKKSMLLAVNCGDDTDCTAATIGSIMGIINGTAGLPQDWVEHVGDKIVTCCINQGTSFPRVRSCTQLTEKVVTLAPAVTVQMRAPFRPELTFVDSETEVSEKDVNYFALPYGQSEETEESTVSVLSLKRPNTLVKNCGSTYALVSVDGGPYIAPGETKKLTISFQNRFKALGNQPHNMEVSLILPEGWTASDNNFYAYVSTWQSKVQNSCHCEPIDITLTAPENLPANSRILVIINEVGRCRTEAVSIHLIRRLSESVHVYDERFANY